MIQSCGDKETETVLNRLPSKKFQKIQSRAEERLALLDAASDLRDLALPSLRLEKLSGDRKGQYSIRINGQYRICFHWREGHASEVEIVDYH
jgi:proteic killer suppression protein